MNKNIKENDIRPDSLMAGERKALKQDILWLKKHSSKLIAAPCPSCGNRSGQKIFIKQNFTYNRCPQCFTMYISPRLAPDTLNEFYKSSAYYIYWNKYIFPASENARREKIFKPRADRVVELCKKYKVRTKKFLEVGAGFGTFCQELRSRKIFNSITAVEPTPNLAATCRSKGIETIELPIEKVVFPTSEKFDTIASFEVIEHLFSPIKFLKHCHRLLKPGGLFIVTCPNGEGLDISVLGKLSDNVDHGHLNYFNPQSLASLLKKCGFSVLETQTPGKLDAELIRKKILSKKYKAKDNSFLLKILTTDWERAGDSFQKFIADNGLSSHLWVVARANR